MSERGMIFNAEMVRAILDGRKTQTRRPMKPQPEKISSENECGKPGYWIPFNAGKTMVRNGDMSIACPFGAVGDRLWVRETWAVVSHAFDDDGLMVDYVPDRPSKAVHERAFGRGYYSGHAIYAADGGFTWCDDDGCVDGRSCWKPSLHMPRWASRITLEIAGVRVERLQDISAEDVTAEGIKTLGESMWGPQWWDDAPQAAINDAQLQFSIIWSKIYGEESWQANPWVWVVEFKRVEDEQ